MFDNPGKLVAVRVRRRLMVREWNGFTFRTGQRVPVYARDHGDELSTTCARTRLVADQDKELDELQTLTSRANSVVH